MKLLVFAHTPPPHHGQSYMVKLMLEGFADQRHGIECFHVNARFSKGMEDIGAFQGAKLFLIFFYCAKAIWLRFRHDVDNFYYVPAPGKRVALYRDWLVMLICRPFFKNIILHWHAAGLAKWLETSVQIRTRALTYRLFKPVDLSIVLSRYNVADAEKLLSRRVRVVPNGIPDPCPDFARAILPPRQARFAARKTGHSQTLRVLYLAHCTREKGLFDALEGVARANAMLEKASSRLRLHLTVAGAFANADEQADFIRRAAQLAQSQIGATIVDYLGFINGEKKWRAFAESDLFLFPSFYHAESFGLVLVEAMAFGLPIITTRWRSIPELFPNDYPGLVNIQSPGQIATALIQLGTATNNWPSELRAIFLERFSLESHLAALATAIHDAAKPVALPAWQVAAEKI